MAYNFTDNRVQFNLDPTKTIVSPQFKELKDTPSSILEGAYITYQISDLNVTLGVLDGTEIVSPEENSFYHNTITKESERYVNSTWETLETSLLDLIVESGFSSTWRPVVTLIREPYIEICIPKEYLPINVESSQTLFVGFKDVSSSNSLVRPAIGIPLNGESVKFYDREDNVVISLPMTFSCNFLPITNDIIEELEDSKNYNTNKHKTIHYLLSEYKSFSNNNKSDKNSVNLNGSMLKF